MDRATLEMTMKTPDHTVEELIVHYQKRVTSGIPDDYNTEIEVLLALNTRDVIEDRKAELSLPQLGRIGEIDRLLVAQHERTGWVLPTTSSFKPSAQERWWWRLYEGPQVAPQELRP